MTTFLEIRSANLEDGRQPSSRDQTILDQIKRSAGNTPAKRHNHFHRHSALQDDDDTRSGDMDPLHCRTDASGFGSTPRTDLALCSVTSGEFSLFQPSSSPTKDEIHQLFRKTYKNVVHHKHDKNEKENCGGSHMEKVVIPASTLRTLDTRRTFSTEENTEFSALPSVESRSNCSNDDDRSWENDGCEEQVSLLDCTDGEEDEEYTTSGVMGGTDDDSYNDSDDDDETLFSTEKSIGPITGVESFLDELAEVEGVQDLGSLLYQVGSCNFAADNQTADDEFSVNSDAFPTIPLERQEQRRFATRNHPENDHHPPLLSSSSSFVEGTTDTIALILHSMSVTTDTLFDIMHSQSVTSEGKETNHDEKVNSDSTTPTNANLSFFQSIFGCQG